MRKAHIGIAGVSALLIAGCHTITASDDDVQCARLNAFFPDSAQMHVAEQRQFAAQGSVSSGPSTCVGMIKGGFSYSTDNPDVATVESTTGLVTAHAAGVARVMAHQKRQGIEYRGELRLRVEP